MKAYLLAGEEILLKGKYIRLITIYSSVCGNVGDPSAAVFIIHIDRLHTQWGQDTLYKKKERKRERLSGQAVFSCKGWC